jgi:hypothetical protein
MGIKRDFSIAELTCSICEKVFSTKKSLNSHRVVHDENRASLPCPYKTCNRLYYFERNLRSHIHTVHKGNKYTCDMCGRTLTTKQKIRLHIIARHETAADSKKKRRKPAERRKDAGIARKSMLSRLTGINLLPSTERKLLKRMPSALLRDKVVEEAASSSDASADKA